VYIFSPRARFVIGLWAIKLARKLKLLLLFLLRLFYKAVFFPERLRFTAGTFNEDVTSERPSRSVTCKTGPMEGLRVQTATTDGNCQISSSHLKGAFY
jgi:hypothetical protein